MTNTVKQLRKHLDNGPHDTYEVYDIANDALTALEAVMEIHARHTAFDGNLDYCPICVNSEGALYPCDTVRAITNALGG